MASGIEKQTKCPSCGKTINYHLFRKGEAYNVIKENIQSFLIAMVILFAFASLILIIIAIMMAGTALYIAAIVLFAFYFLLLSVPPSIHLECKECGRKFKRFGCSWPMTLKISAVIWLKAFGWLLLFLVLIFLGLIGLIFFVSRL